MDKYELVVIVDAALPQDQKEAVMKSVADEIAKCGGKVVNRQVWIDRQRMSFQMKKSSEGTYYLVNFEGGGARLAELRQAMRINEKILRSLIIKVKR